MKNLKQYAKEVSSATLAIMEGREKGDQEGLQGEIVTITDYDFMNGDNGQYAVFIVREYKDVFFFAGQVLTDHLEKMTAEGYKEQIQKEGLPMVMSKKKSKNGRYYNTVIFYPES